MFIPKLRKRTAEYPVVSKPRSYNNNPLVALPALASLLAYIGIDMYFRSDIVTFCSIPLSGLKSYQGAAARFIPVTMHKAERYAVDMALLDQDTLVFLLKSFGCSRKVYNLYVDHLYNTLEQLGYKGGCELPDIKLPEVTAFKKIYPYLKEVDSLALANAKHDFDGAVKRFNQEYDHKSYTKRALRRDRSGTEALSFRGLKGMPKFHSKAHGDFSYNSLIGPIWCWVAEVFGQSQGTVLCLM